MASPLRRPYMLHDLIQNAQRLSASLPPDDWSPKTSRPLLARHDSGAMILISRMSKCGDWNVRLMNETLKPCKQSKEKAKWSLCECFGRSRSER